MKHRMKMGEPGVIKSILIGVGLSTGLLVAFAFISALIISFTKDPTSLIGIFTIGTVILSAVISSTIISRLRKEKGLLYAVICAIIISTLMLLIGLIATGGRLSGGVPINCACYIGASALSALLFKPRGKRRRIR